MQPPRKCSACTGASRTASGSSSARQSGELRQRRCKACTGDDRAVLRQPRGATSSRRSCGSRRSGRPRSVKPRRTRSSAKSACSGRARRKHLPRKSRARSVGKSACARGWPRVVQWSHAANPCLCLWYQGACSSNQEAQEGRQGAPQAREAGTAREQGCHQGAVPVPRQARPLTRSTAKERLCARDG